MLSQNYFPKYKQYRIETPSEIFALTQTALDFVDDSTQGHKTEKDKVSALVNAIFSRSNLSVDYLAQANTTASQTFESGAANCLSLTIMVFSMSKHLGLNASFREVNIPEFWTRRGGNTLINGHINLKIKPREDYRNVLIKPRPITVDFDPLQGNRRFNSEAITRRQIVSYFYANKAADAMINGNSNLAYAYLKAALLTSKNNGGAWLNLGVLFSRNGMFVEAEAAYQNLIHSKKNYSTALENLAHLYRKTNRVSAANEITKRLSRQRRNNPSYHMMLGDIAFEEKKYKSAVKHYKQSLSLNNKPHEIHFNLAKAYLALGDIKNTKRYLQNANRRAKAAGLGQQYASKLSLLAGR